MQVPYYGATSTYRYNMLYICKLKYNYYILLLEAKLKLYHSYYIDLLSRI